MAASANFTANGSALPPELAVAGGATVTLELTSVSGVRTIVWSIEGNSSHTLVNPTITPSGSPLGATATFTMPVGAGQGYIVQCVVNGGKDDEGVVNDSLTKRAIIGVVNGNGVVPLCNGETTERSATYGYTEVLNAGLGGTGSGTIADGSVTFAKLQAIGVGFIGNDAGTATPKLIIPGPLVAITAGALTLASIAAHTFLGNNTAVSAAPVALTATQLTAELDVATTTTKGLVPAPGTATGKVLKDDLTWGTVTGTFTSPSNPGDNGKIAYASAGANAWAANITTDGTSFFFGAVAATGALLGVLHNKTVLSGILNAGGGAQDTLIRWGVVANDELTFGGSTSVAAIRSRVNTGGLHSWEVNGTQVASFGGAGATVTSLATTGAVASAFKVTDAAHTSLTASTERQSVLFDLSQTRTWATGALATQRALRVVAPTLAFAGASTVTTAATVAISGAPTAGANATITQGLALWVEAGGIGYGSSAALTGLNRYAASAQIAVGRSSTSTDLNLMRFGVTATDQLTLGDDPLPSLWNYASTTFGVRVGGATRLTVSTTQVDFNGLSGVNLLALNGTRIAEGALGTALADADETLSVAGGNVYEQTSAPTANRSKRLGITGGPVLGEIISIRRFTTDSNTLTINDEVGGFLYMFPAGQKRIAEFVFNGTKFQLIGHMRLT